MPSVQQRGQSAGLCQQTQHVVNCVGNEPTQVTIHCLQVDMSWLFLNIQYYGL